MKRYTKILAGIVPSALLATAITVTPALAAGGAFSASYTGTATTAPGCGVSSCTITVSGSGKASFLGASTEAGTLTGKLTSFPCGTGGGTITLTSSSTAANSITVSANGKACLQSGGKIKFNLKYTVTGGTGKFAHASGSGTITATSSLSSGGAYSDHWKGTLTF